MGKRLFKVFIVLGYMVILFSMVGIVVEYFIDGKSDAVNFFPMVFLSLVPISLLSVVQYVVFGKLYLSFLFENKERYKWISGVIFAIFLGLSLLWGYAKKMEYDKHRDAETLLQIRNHTYYDYHRKEHKGFSDEEHNYLFSLVWDNKKMTDKQMETFSDDVLSLAVDLKKKKKVRVRALITFAKETFGCNESNIGVTGYGDVWIRKNVNSPYKILDYDLIRDGVVCEAEYKNKSVDVSDLVFEDEEKENNK